MVSHTLIPRSLGVGFIAVRYQTSQRPPGEARRWFGHGDGSASPNEVQWASELPSNGVSMDDFGLDDDSSLECKVAQYVFSAGARAALAKFDEDHDGLSPSTRSGLPTVRSVSGAAAGPVRRSGTKLMSSAPAANQSNAADPSTASRARPRIKVARRSIAIGNGEITGIRQGVGRGLMAADRRARILSDASGPPPFGR